MDPRPTLLRLRLRGRIDDPGDAESAALVAAGLATARRGALMLSAAGRSEADRVHRLTDEALATARDAYEQFLPRNRELIQVCNDWQVRPGGTPNDHRDHTYDWSVVDRLALIDDRAGPVIRRLGRRVEEFGGYRERLRAARRRVEDGERDWFTSPRIDSYHTVWMELHEHLLVATGIARGAEPEPATGTDRP
ncbi:MAG: MarR family transcriptional regulator [Acidimicrobiia bacterium]